MKSVNTETSLDGTRWGLDVVVTEDGGKPTHAAGLVYDIETGNGFMSLGQKVITFNTNYIRDLDNHFSLVRGYVLGKYGVDLPKSTIDPEHSLGVLDCYTPAGERQRSRIALIDTTDILEPETQTGKIVFSLDHDLNDSFLTQTESNLIKNGLNVAIGGTISVNLCLDYMSMASSDDDIRNVVGSTAIAELTKAIRTMVIGTEESSPYTAQVSDQSIVEDSEEDEFSFMAEDDEEEDDNPSNSFYTDDDYMEEDEDEEVLDGDLVQSNSYTN